MRCWWSVNPIFEKKQTFVAASRALSTTYSRHVGDVYSDLAHKIKKQTKVGVMMRPRGSS